MNILHITTYLQGGAGKIISDLAVHQKKCGGNVIIVTTDTEEIGYCNYKQYLQELVENDIEVLKIDSSFKRDIYLNLNVVEAVRRIISTYNIELIHAHAAVPAFIGVNARAGFDKYIPVIQTMHGWGTNKQENHEKIDKIIMNGLDRIIAVSKSDKELMINKGIEGSRIITIYNGIDVTDNKSKCDINKDIVIEEITEKKMEGYLILGCIGTVCKRKNQKILIDALKRIDKNQKIFTVFIGEGDMLENLRNYSKDLWLKDRIKFYGYKNHASKYIRYFDYYVFASTSEGLSLGILEGFREKAPIIASRIPSFTECIEDKINGFLFESENVDSLKQVIEDICINNKKVQLLEEVIDNGYRRLMNDFTMDKMIMNYVKVYEELILKSNKLS